MKKIFVLGGGAAGFFAAIHSKMRAPETAVILVEKSDRVLMKVKVSGGGRCNVTQACFDVPALAANYPRGGKELIGPLHVFQPKDTMEWFTSHGVPLKIETDRRVFPVSNSSQSIIDCLVNVAEKLGIECRKSCAIKDAQKNADGFVLTFENGAQEIGDRLILATGSSLQGYEWAAKFGHKIVSPVPSLFTFTVQDSALAELSGLSVQDAMVSVLEHKKISARGPVLITHWGFSGPAILRLSAWGARELAAMRYHFKIKINWMAAQKPAQVLEELSNFSRENHKKLAASAVPFKILPTRFWRYLLQKCEIPLEKKWGNLSKKDFLCLVEKLSADIYSVSGKGIFKEEFVTAGGVSTQEVNFKTMESLRCPGLYFAGEILDVDGITGGYNFQNAWTTGFIAGHHAAKF